jgi:hypothetical protein
MLISRRSFLLSASIVAGLSVRAGIAQAQDMSPVPGKRVALGGYDPVAYFTKRQPTKGSARYWSTFDDVVYFFENGEHRALFMSTPDKYAPQYAGFCAGGIALGVKVAADPEAWIISDDKLFVFSDRRDVTDFAADPAAFAARSEAGWKKLHGSH